MDYSASIFPVILILTCFSCHDYAIGLSVNGFTDAISRNLLFFLSDCTLGANKTRLLFNSRNARGIEVNLTVPTPLPIDPSLRTIFIVHGFLSDGTKDWINNTIDAFLRDEPINIFSVDWRVGACSEKIDILNVQSYNAATLNTEEVGRYVAGCVKMLVKNYAVQLKNVWMIGHSLGAHVCGFTAKNLKQSNVGTVGRITGLDPAGPKFRELGSNERLDKSDASFVEIVHTSSLFGLQEPIGHVDLYINGGNFQSSCLLRSLGCSHARSVDYYLEAIKNPDCLFWGKMWSRKFQFNRSPPNCSESSCTVMGPRAENYPARGTFGMFTNKHSPYCTGTPPNALDTIDVTTSPENDGDNLFEAQLKRK